MLTPHKADKAHFIKSVNLTAERTGFSPWVVEKDYFCSLVLKRIFELEGCNLVFKGGTLLNKVHAGFYRMSEDLDFSVDAIPITSRVKRRAAAQKAKNRVIQSVQDVGLKFYENFSGYNENQAYKATISYPTSFLPQDGKIKVDFTLFEPIGHPLELTAATLLLDCLRLVPVLKPFRVIGFSVAEAYAEKIRAALSRNPPAIRDLFDIQYALDRKIICLDNLLPRVQEKLNILNRTIDVSAAKKEYLQNPIYTELQPILRDHDFKKFDFNKSWGVLEKIGLKLKSRSYMRD